MSSPPLVRALILSCHPIPSLAVTLIGAGLAVLADLTPARVVQVTMAVLCGQLSIGWSNDYLDAERDQSVQRSDKPVATGTLSPRLALVAAVVATVGATAFSATLGWAGGLISMGIVLSGWVYNLGVKATTFSWLPFAVAFGLLPAIGTLTESPPQWAQWWALTAGALLGIAAHLANVLPDLRHDIATGVLGVGHRIGERATASTTAMTLFVTSAVVLFGPPGTPGPWRWLVFTVTIVLAAVAAVTALRDSSSPLFFRATIAIAGLDVLSFALAEHAFN